MIPCQAPSLKADSEVMLICRKVCDIRRGDIIVRLGNGEFKRT